MKVVVGKGMPFYKDICSFGDLVIQFEVEWPTHGSINNKQRDLLIKALPGRAAKKVQDDEEYSILEDWEKDQRNSNPEGGNSKKRKEYEDDQDEDKGRQGVGCNPM